MAKAITNPEDIVGEHFGKLTVAEYLGRIKKGRQTVPMYKCVCDCGNAVETDRWLLLKGDKKSCGCAYKDAGRARKEDFTGRRFGRWTVIGPAPTRYSKSGKTRRIMWKCRCDCGTVKDVGARALKTGMSTSCGCFQKENISAIMVDDLTGQHFGSLTVVRRAGSTIDGKTGRAKHAIWHCVCSCGKELDVMGFSLKNGDTTSCGCRKSSKYEDMTAEYLDQCGYKKDVDYFREYTFDGLIGVGGGLLRVDFFVHLHDGRDLIIECQGKQHYRVTKWYGGKPYLQKLQEHDRRKREYAIKHNIEYAQVFPDSITFEQVVNNLREQGVM